MISKEILYLGKQVILACDGKCDKAWGISNRETIQLDENDLDDIAYLSDNELDVAPKDPGTYEGTHAKPYNNSELLNKWCCRECERSSIFNIEEKDIEKKLKDFSNRVYNIPLKVIQLNAPKKETKLSGFENGKLYYSQNLKHKIYIDRKHIIEINTAIKDISISFINGLIEEAQLNGISKYTFKNNVTFKGNKYLLEKIELALS